MIDVDIDDSDRVTQDDINALLSYQKEVLEYTMEADAGSAAMAVIDFGSVCENEVAIGAGIGYANSFDGSAVAGAAGAKYGFTNNTAGVVKILGC